MTTQLDMFGASDTPLFSGTPVRVKADTFQPTLDPAYQAAQADDNTVPMFDKSEPRGNVLVYTLRDDNYTTVQAMTHFARDYFQDGRLVDMGSIKGNNFSLIDGVSTYTITHCAMVPAISPARWEIRIV